MLTIAVGVSGQPASLWKLPTLWAGLANVGLRSEWTFSSTGGFHPIRPSPFPRFLWHDIHVDLKLGVGRSGCYNWRSEVRWTLPFASISGLRCRWCTSHPRTPSTPVVIRQHDRRPYAPLWLWLCLHAWAGDKTFWSFEITRWRIQVFVEAESPEVQESVACTISHNYETNWDTISKTLQILQYWEGMSQW